MRLSPGDTHVCASNKAAESGRFLKDSRGFFQSILLIDRKYTVCEKDARLILSQLFCCWLASHIISQKNEANFGQQAPVKIFRLFSLNTYLYSAFEE